MILRPHSYGEKCEWCGATLEAREDGLVSAECAAHDPVEYLKEREVRALNEAIALRKGAAERHRKDAVRYDAEVAVLLKHLDAISQIGR